jgi:3-isopropylmalate/(R)-2-methylmalate dehydratase large subunit
MTICNMSIEMGARGGLIAPDMTTYQYLNRIPAVESRPDYKSLLLRWRWLKSDPDALFDAELQFNASDIRPMITFGTNPGMGMAVDASIPEADSVSEGKASFLKSLEYMGFGPGEKLIGHPVDYVFVGSCTNGRIEDLRAFTMMVKGRKKAKNITALIVPGSKRVEQQAIREGLDKILAEAGFTLRQPGCSSCLAMNEDKIPAGKYAVSTSNRNFEGRQGPGSRTLLASPLTAAAAAITGKITNPADLC